MSTARSSEVREVIFRNRKKSNVDYASKRLKMVEVQIARRNVRDKAVLDAMRTVPRHLFVPDSLRDEAYDDGPLPIGCEQTISQPYVVASMTEELELTHHSRVLEIGTGSGYQAAVIAEIAREVYTIEIVAKLLDSARALFEQLHYRNIYAKQGDGSLGWPEYAPYNGVILTAAAPHVPEALIEQLAPDGIVILPLRGSYPDSQELVKIRKTSSGLERETLYAVRFVPMTGEIEE
ncbi:MAG: protein-L-isoaspartate(D-aspartate) O-methyltransferase [Candidatus Zixiibacteriota bacterium]|nr:MAG: protein-L-isoaspartate(D-aspartate) O-methyltransferase [candidate division Zixibacteria bacterium]